MTRPPLGFVPILNYAMSAMINSRFLPSTRNLRSQCRSIASKRASRWQLPCVGRARTGFQMSRHRGRTCHVSGSSRLRSHLDGAGTRVRMPATGCTAPRRWPDLSRHLNPSSATMTAPTPTARRRHAVPGSARLIPAVLWRPPTRAASASSSAGRSCSRRRSWSTPLTSPGCSAARSPPTRWATIEGRNHYPSRCRALRRLVRGASGGRHRLPHGGCAAAAMASQGGLTARDALRRVLPIPAMVGATRDHACRMLSGVERRQSCANLVARFGSSRFRREQGDVERVPGIEPGYSAWKAAALPLSYTRIDDQTSRSARFETARIGTGSRQVWWGK